ncbi:MAG: hypothetical protein GX896_04870, partial [Clostridiales bacterium]|nr:hypothetical protein [Clostridiales bacterium]
AQMAGEGESGGFLQVSGLIYEIDTKIPTSVVQDEKGLFVNVSGEYRVKNVMVGDQPLDLKKTYKLASHNYLLKNGGDGYTMFMDNKILLDEFKLDYDALISYFVDTLGGKVSADSQYLNVYGQGRIKVIVNSEKPTCIDNGFIERVQGTGTIIETVLATGHNYGEWVVTKEATITEEGVMHRACEDCGHEETKSVAKLLDNSDSSSDSDNNTDSKDIDKLPNTGANFEIIGIVIIAVLGIVIAHLKRKENKK